MRAVIIGGAGFLGSHLCDRFINEGWEVLCLDNLVTGVEENIGHLRPNPRFQFKIHDITRFIDVPGKSTRC